MPPLLLLMLLSVFCRVARGTVAASAAAAAAAACAAALTAFDAPMQMVFSSDKFRQLMLDSASDTEYEGKTTSKP